GSGAAEAGIAVSCRNHFGPLIAVHESSLSGTYDKKIAPRLGILSPFPPNPDLCLDPVLAARCRQMTVPDRGGLLAQAGRTAWLTEWCQPVVQAGYLGRLAKE
ncbi:hypothetical protein ACFVTM_21625, partial [Arthrobacter sp. NPDC058130]|uniref:hypothetical protein n=1 Tax=Arthrobacter sp. NPDC058130 TaxID=3346353 RepID=UPI0036E9F681